MAWGFAVVIVHFLTWEFNIFNNFFSESCPRFAFNLKFERIFPALFIAKKLVLLGIENFSVNPFYVWGPPPLTLTTHRKETHNLKPTSLWKWGEKLDLPVHEERNLIWLKWNLLNVNTEFPDWKYRDLTPKPML